MRLCIATGAGPNYEQVAESLPERIFRNWRAFDAYVEPFEDRRQDLRVGLLATALEAVLGQHEPLLEVSHFSLTGENETGDISEHLGEGEDWRIMKAKLTQISAYYEE